MTMDQDQQRDYAEEQFNRDLLRDDEEIGGKIGPGQHGSGWTDYGGFELPCGAWHNGTVLCDRHEAKAAKAFPQGWRYYPGDVCPHGKYTGGVGRDLLCGQCEGWEE